MLGAGDFIVVDVTPYVNRLSLPGVSGARAYRTRVRLVIYSTRSRRSLTIPQLQAFALVICLITGIYALGTNFADRFKHAFDWSEEQGDAKGAKNQVLTLRRLNSIMTSWKPN